MERDRLVRLVKRAPVLEALRAEALDRQELQDALDVSKPTVHRIARSLGEMGVVDRTEGEFKLTEQGQILADEFERLEAVVEAADRLAPLLETVAVGDLDLDVETFADATVTLAEPGSPYQPLERFLALVESTGSLRGFDSTTLAPVSVGTIYGRIADGMETEVVYPPDTAAGIMETAPDRGQEMIESGNLRVWVHDDVPCGLAIFDDRVGLGGYDATTGTLVAFADTAAPEARAWAEETFEAYRDEARPLVE